MADVLNAITGEVQPQLLHIRKSASRVRTPVASFVRFWTNQGKKMSGRYS